MRPEYKALMDMYLDEIKRIIKNPALTPQDGEAAHKALCAIEKIYKCQKYDEEEEAEKMDRENGYSERRGRGSNGRYISRMIDKLEDMKEDAPDYHTRKTISRAIDKLEDDR